MISINALLSQLVQILDKKLCIDSQNLNSHEQ